jgi:hypothetical protein
MSEKEASKSGWMEWKDGYFHFMESCKLGSCGRVVCLCNRFELPPPEVVYGAANGPLF